MHAGNTTINKWEVLNETIRDWWQEMQNMALIINNYLSLLKSDYFKFCYSLYHYITIQYIIQYNTLLIIWRVFLKDINQCLVKYRRFICKFEFVLVACHRLHSLIVAFVMCWMLLIVVSSILDRSLYHPLDQINHHPTFNWILTCHSTMRNHTKTNPGSCNGGRLAPALILWYEANCGPSAAVVAWMKWSVAADIARVDDVFEVICGLVRVHSCKLYYHQCLK
jgi:hypothetical protein